MLHAVDKRHNTGSGFGMAISKPYCLVVNKCLIYSLRENRRLKNVMVDF